MGALYGTSSVQECLWHSLIWQPKMTGGGGISQLEGIFRLRFDYAHAQKGRTFYRPSVVIALEPRPGSVQEKLDELRAFAISRLNRLRDVLADPKAIDEARALLAERVGMVTLERDS